MKKGGALAVADALPLHFVVQMPCLRGHFQVWQGDARGLWPGRMITERLQDRHGEMV